MKYKTRVRVNWDIDFSKHTYKLSENVAALVETLTEDMGVDLFDLSEVGTAMENRDELAGIGNSCDGEFAGESNHYTIQFPVDDSAAPADSTMAA
nr:hypothetical protein CFP56_15619 [Quercus suber]